MTKFKKIIVAVMVSLMLILPLSATASAADLVDPDNINGIAKYFGIDLSDPESIQKAIDEIREGGLSGIMNLFGIDIADILDTLEEYIGSMEVPTTKPQETTTAEPTTEEPATQEPTTEEPATTPPPIYTPTYPTYPSYTPSYPVTTLPPVETTTFQFIPPEQIYTEAYTTTVFSPIVEDDINDIGSDVNPVKTAIGVVLLLASGVGVIIVVLALKRNRI